MTLQSGVKGGSTPTKASGKSSGIKAKRQAIKLKVHNQLQIFTK
jgi:hypothetical protein